MKIALNKKDDPRGPHAVLVCDRDEAPKIHHTIAWDVLRGQVRPVREVAPDGNIVYRFNMRYLERLGLTFPMADFSPGVIKRLNRAEEIRLSEMPVPDVKIPGFTGRLYDFQKIAVKLLLDYYYAKECKYPDIIDILNDEVGLGKGAPLSTPVLTPYGWERIGDLKVGDKVIGKNGNPTKVIGVYPQPKQDVYKVTFSDGSWVKCDGPHLWAVKNSNDITRGNDWRILTTEQMFKGDAVVVNGSGQNKNKRYEYNASYKTPSGSRQFCVPMVEPVHFEPEDLPINPYVLGVILGDGWISSTGLVHIDKGDDTKAIRDLLDAEGTNTNDLKVGFGVDGLKEELCKLRLNGKRAWEKKVPRAYRRGFPDDRLAFLQGLMDTDGYPMPDGGAEFSSTSKSLIKSVIEIVRSLGGVARGKRIAASTYTYNGEKLRGRKAWRVNIKLPSPYRPFRLPRKRDQYIVPTKYQPARWIENIELVGAERSVCIRVAASDQLYVTKDYIVTHNSFVALAVIRKLKAYPALIICPNNAKYNWADYIEEFFDMEYVVVDGTKAEREYQIDKRAQITIVNWEAIRAKPIHEHGSHGKIIGYEFSNPALFYEPWEFVVADEYHRAKTPGRQVTNGLFQLEGKDWLPMSGTPLLNKVEEAWPMLHKLWPDLYPSYDGFKKKIGIPAPNNPNVMVAYKPDAMSELKKFMQSKSLRRRKDQVMKDLPKTVEVKKLIELTPEQRKLYNKIADELRLEMADGTIKSVMGALPYITRLKQACASPELYGGSPHSAKIEELKRLVEELVENGEKAIIYSQWTTMTRIIQRELSKYNPAYVTGEYNDLKYRHQEAKRFLNDSDCKLYIGTIGANREAINLGSATWVIFTDEGWTPATDEDQPVGRSAAGGLRGAHLPKGTKVHVVKLRAVDTIEERLENLLRKKRNLTSRMTERDAGKKIRKVTIDDIKDLL